MYSVPVAPACTVPRYIYVGFAFVAPPGLRGLGRRGLPVTTRRCSGTTVLRPHQRHPASPDLRHHPAGPAHLHVVGRALSSQQRRHATPEEHHRMLHPPPRRCRSPPSFHRHRVVVWCRRRPQCPQGFRVSPHHTRSSDGFTGLPHRAPHLLRFTLSRSRHRRPEPHSVLHFRCHPDHRTHQW